MKLIDQVTHTFWTPERFAGMDRATALASVGIIEPFQDDLPQFYVEDEPQLEIEAIFEAGEKFLTEAPREVIRAWAKENGLAVKESGRLPQEVIDAFHAERG